MSDNHQFEYFLLRYAPDPIKNEYVNIGVVVLGNDGFVRVRMSENWNRVLCMDPDADLELFAALGRDLETQLSDTSNRAAVLKRMLESFSGALQMSSSTAFVSDAPEEELKILTRLYVHSRPIPGRHEVRGRQKIVRIMQDEFERAGVWELMKHHIAVSDYVPGDPLKIDCGYRPNGTIKMFHAVSLANSIDLAKILAFTYPRIIAGMMKKNLHAELMAIVDTLDRERPEVSFALQTLQESGLAISNVEEMPTIAERVRRELRA